MGTQLIDPININQRLEPINDMINRRHFKKALTMSHRLNEDVLEQPGRHRNVNVAYWQQRAMIELKLRKLDDALASFKMAFKYSNDDPQVRVTFGRDLAIYLVKSGEESVHCAVRFLTGNTDNVKYAIDQLLAPMVNGDLDHQALRRSIIGRFWLRRSTDLTHDKLKQNSLDRALEYFMAADKHWETMTSGRNEQWRLNNRVYLYMALRLVRHITPDELRLRDEMYRFVIKNDPSKKRRVVIRCMNMHRGIGRWVARRMA